MSIPSRDSLLGILFYYSNVLAFILLSIYAWNTPGIVMIVITLLSFLFLVIQDATWLKRNYYVPQDKILIEKLTEYFEDRHTREFLTEFDLRKYLINDRNLKNLEIINRDWQGVDYEFKNQDYQDIWEEMQVDIDALLSILHHHVRHSNANNFTVNDSQKGDQANRLNEKIYRAYQRFRRIYIQKMEGN